LARTDSSDATTDTTSGRRIVRPAKKSLESLGGFDAELAARQLPEDRALAQRFAAVALGQVYADYRSVSALSEGLGRDGGKPCVERLGEATGSCELSAQRVERPEPELAESLTLDEHPVLIPVRKQILGEHGQFDVCNIAQPAGDNRSSKRFYAAEVHVHSAVEADPRTEDGDQGVPAPADAPERGPEAGGGTLVARLGPERAGHADPQQRPLVESEEGDQPLRA
jgi:hypothetical protein